MKKQHPDTQYLPPASARESRPVAAATAMQPAEADTQGLGEERLQAFRDKLRTVREQVAGNNAQRQAAAIAAAKASYQAGLAVEVDDFIEDAKPLISDFLKEMLEDLSATFAAQGRLTKEPEAMVARQEADKTGISEEEAEAFYAHLEAHPSFKRELAAILSPLNVHKILYEKLGEAMQSIDVEAFVAKQKAKLKPRLVAFKKRREAAKAAAAQKSSPPHPFRKERL